MKKNKLLSLSLCAALACSMLTGCSCKHTYTSQETAGVFADKVVTHTCTKCGESYTETTDKATKSLKILAIGNSFSVNSTNHLYDLAIQCGAEDVVIGCLWIPGSFIENHVTNSISGKAAYQYRKNSTGEWQVTGEALETATGWMVNGGISLLDGIQDEDWDIITIQQQSIYAGMATGYSKVEDLAEYVDQNKTNPDCKLWWNMTWAYDADCTSNPDFTTYFDNNPQKMYEHIVKCVESEILTKDIFAGVIPCGTTMQNLRTSYLTDMLTLDGYHASNILGCYALSLTWLGTMTDLDVDSVTWMLKTNNIWGSAYDVSISYDEAALIVIKEAVSNALKSPYEVTASSYSEPVFE